MQLLPSQELILQELVVALPHFPVLIVTGPSKSGKDVIVSSLFEREHIVSTLFDLTDLPNLNTRSMKCQDLHAYLDALNGRLNLVLNENIANLGYLSLAPDKAAKRSREQVGDPTTSPHRVIYIRSLDRIISFFTDYYAEQRKLFFLVFNRWLRRLPTNYHVVATCRDHKECVSQIDVPYSLHLLNITPSDLQVYLGRTQITPPDQFAILALSRKPNLGATIASIKFALAVTPKDESILPTYTRSMANMSDSPFETDQRIPQPTDEEMIGLDSIRNEIRTNIILPIEFNTADIPIKKGMVLYGPPGTGKTSIGRWLAHILKGRFYLVRGQDGTSGHTFIEAIDAAFTRAKNNAPAVVFIDDVDTIFSNTDSYRAFLTLLDGIDTKDREAISVIVTCMNLRNIPASLLRGGRLEMVLHTALPSNENIQRIVRSGLARMSRALLRALGQTEIGLTEALSDLSTPVMQATVRTISNKMTGWNCADITRCVNDVTRQIIAAQIYQKVKVTDVPVVYLVKVFDHVIGAIRHQYDNCGHYEEYSQGDNTRLTYCN